MQRLNESLITDLEANALSSERKRAMYNFHDSPADTLHRMVNFLTSGTYVQPHKHESPDKREAFIVLKGDLLLVEFSGSGDIMDYELLNPEKGNYGAEVQPGIWHTIIPLSKEVVIYEVKDGPYENATDKVPASFAPSEEHPDKAAYIQKLLDTVNIDYE